MNSEVLIHRGPLDEEMILRSAQAAASDRALRQRGCFLGSQILHFGSAWDPYPES